MTPSYAYIPAILLLTGAGLALSACVVEPWPGYYPRYSYAPPPPASSALPDRAAAPPAESYCREFHGEAVIDGRTQNLTGTACRQSDGQWRAVR
jgi:hypothetical protein